MTWLRPLDDLQATHLPEVGYKAYCLGRLSQRQMPVATGQVITARAWQAMMAELADLALPGGDRRSPIGVGPASESPPLAALHTLDIHAFQTLQRSSQQAQRQLRSTPLPTELQAALQPWPHPTWLLRSSLWLNPGGRETHPLAPAMTGLLPAQVGSPLTSTLAQALHQFWGQALTARSLVLWQHYGQTIPRLGLATLVMPIYPALASGTLSLGQGKAALQAVAGLGLPLSRGEAIPARCHLALNNPEAAEWAMGFQEQVYHLAADPQATAPPGLPLRITPRDRADLPPPLTPEQLHHLLQLGHQAQAILTEELPPLLAGWRPVGLHLEWLLCPTDQASGWEFVITQATPQLEKVVAPAAMPKVAGRSRPLPSLPSLSTVVRGIGASTGQVQGVAVVATQAQDLPRPLPPKAIVVLPDLQPDVFLQLEAVAGIVTERGGATCHAAILAREIGVPAVVGAPQATELLKGEAYLWLDGDRGVVYGLTPEAASALRSQTVPPPLVIPATADPLLALQTDRYRTLQTKVMANLSQTRRLSTLPLDHIAGIGLLRSEWLLLDILDGRHPWHWVNQGQEAELQSRLVQQLEIVLQALGPKPLRYRSLDLRSHEWQALEGSPPPEPNPMLGLRGTLSYDVDARLFEVELAALATLQRAGYSNLQLILPFVRTVEEVLTCRQYVRQAGLTDAEDFALWIMAEVPSVLFLLPAYAQAGIHGIAIGSNDLTQLLLAVDRDQPTLASAYDERHPVVQQAIAYLIREAHRNGMVCSICGQAPVRYPDLIASLVDWGINSISVEAAALPFTLEAVWQAEQNRTK